MRSAPRAQRRGAGAAAASAPHKAGAPQPDLAAKALVRFMHTILYPRQDIPAPRPLTQSPGVSTMSQFNRRDSLKSLAALASASALGGWSALANAQKPLTVGVIYVGPRDDYGYNQAQAQAAAELKKMPGVKVVEEENVPETAAVQKTMTGDDRAGRRQAAVPDLVRLLRSAHPGGGAEEPRRALLPLRRHVDRGQAPEERRQLLRLHRRVPVPQRRDRRPHDEEQQDRLRRRQADPAGAAQHQRLHAGRALGQAGHHHAA